MSRSLSRLPAHFSLIVEVRDHLFDGRNGLLDCGNLIQLLIQDRANTILKGDDHLPASFLQLDQRQTMIGRIVHFNSPLDYISLYPNFDDMRLQDQFEF